MPECGGATQNSSERTCSGWRKNHIHRRLTKFLKMKKSSVPTTDVIFNGIVTHLVRSGCKWISVSFCLSLHLTLSPSRSSVAMVWMCVCVCVALSFFYSQNSKIARRRFARKYWNLAETHEHAFFFILLLCRFTSSWNIIHLLSLTIARVLIFSSRFLQRFLPLSLSLSTAR